MARTPVSAQRRRDVPPPRSGTGEKQVLTGFLDYLRESVASKLDGAPEPEVRTAMVASGTNLLGVVSHLTNVERFTFLGERVTDWARDVPCAGSKHRGGRGGIPHGCG